MRSARCETCNRLLRVPDNTTRTVFRCPCGEKAVLLPPPRSEAQASAQAASTRTAQKPAPERGNAAPIMGLWPLLMLGPVGVLLITWAFFDTVAARATCILGLVLCV